MKHKAYIIYHSKDLDGLCSGFLAKRWHLAHGAEVVMIPWDYYDKIPDLSDACSITMLDVSFPKAEMDKLSDRLVWIDHHVSAIKENDPSIAGVRKVGDSASLLAWRYFYPHHTIVPPLIYWIDRFDVWKKGEDWEEVMIRQECMRINLKDPEDEYQHKLWEYELTQFTLQRPDAYSAILNINSRAAKRAFLVNFEGLLFHAINHEGNSTIFDSLRDDRCDGLMVFRYDGEKMLWVFSLYDNGKDVDLSVIAKKYGGGGHKGACGFAVNNLETVLNQ